MNSLEITSHGLRRARTRSLVQTGALVEKAGLLETFSLPLGKDFQKDPELKNEVGAFYKGLLILNDIANSDECHKPLWSQQGLAALTATKKPGLIEIKIIGKFIAPNSYRDRFVSLRSPFARLFLI